MVEWKNGWILETSWQHKFDQVCHQINKSHYASQEVLILIFFESLSGVEISDAIRFGWIGFAVI